MRYFIFVLAVIFCLGIFGQAFAKDSLIVASERAARKAQNMKLKETNISTQEIAEGGVTVKTTEVKQTNFDNKKRFQALGSDKKINIKNNPVDNIKQPKAPEIKIKVFDASKFKKVK